MCTKVHEGHQQQFCYYLYIRVTPMLLNIDEMQFYLPCYWTMTRCSSTCHSGSHCYRSAIRKATGCCCCSKVFCNQHDPLIQVIKQNSNSHRYQLGLVVTSLCLIRTATYSRTLFLYNVARMPTHSLMRKSLGSRISACSLMGRYLGYSMYVLFAFTHHIVSLEGEN